MMTKDDMATKLACIHYEIEPSITKIFRLTGTSEAEASPQEPIKLLEVNELTPPSGILPLGFDPYPASGILYPSIIVEVTPEEYQQIEGNQLKLPRGWTVGPLIPRPPEESNGNP